MTLRNRGSTPARDEIVLHVSKLALVPSHPSIPWVPEALTPGMKRPKCEGDHTPPSSTEVKNEWSYISIPPMPSCKANENGFTFTLS